MQRNGRKSLITPSTLGKIHNGTICPEKKRSSALYPQLMLRIFIVTILRSPRMKFMKKLTITEQIRLQRKPKNAGKPGSSNENRKNAAINEGNTKNRNRK